MPRQQTNEPMNEVILPKRTTKILNRETFSARTNRTIVALIVTLALMIVVLSAVFITMTSTTSQKGYELSQLQRQNEALETEKEKLQNELTRSLSFQSISDNKKIQDMAAPEQKSFVIPKKRTAQEAVPSNDIQK